MTAVRALYYESGVLHLLDQRRLPRSILWRKLRSAEAVAKAIRTMAVRGAPSIGVAAAYGMVLAERQGRLSSAQAAQLLGSTRPTAHDLFVGIDRVREAWDSDGDVERAAHDFRREIVDACHQIGTFGAPLLRRSNRVLTHCNAGALATVEWGTALAPIRVARERGAKLFVWVDETRPLLQGSRLTAWELAQEKIPYAVIADNAAGRLMQTGEVDAVIVGADRIVRNGDTANKVGTYEKAVLAHENGIPFYVAAPLSTFDPDTGSGDDIPVEERSPDEVRRVGTSLVTPASSPARNPAFDVTPARYVTAFVTPIGVLKPQEIAKASDSARTRRPGPPSRSRAGRR